MQQLRFLQSSDFHLGARAASPSLHMSEEKARIRVEEEREVLRRLQEIAIENDVDIFLVPGDLFETRRVSNEQISLLQETFASLRPTPVVIAPGNHDHYGPKSYFNSEFLRDCGHKPWPDNVFIFRSTEFESIRLPSLPGVTITGSAYATYRSILERPLARKIDREASTINVLLLHASYEPFPLETEPRSAPFSLEELENQHFDYAAIGHLHSFREICSKERPIAAYSGSPFARGLDEAGERLALIGEVSPEGVHIQPVKMDKRTIQKMEISLKIVSEREEVLGKIRNALASRKIRPEDILVIRLIGSYSPEVELPLPLELPDENYFHCRIENHLEPDYSVETIAANEIVPAPTETVFVRRLLERSASSSQEEGEIIQEAIRFGLSALLNRKEPVFYED